MVRGLPDPFNGFTVKKDPDIIILTIQFICHLCSCTESMFILVSIGDLAAVLGPLVLGIFVALAVAWCRRWAEMAMVMMDVHAK